jgi:hypothetical protein
MPARTVRAEVAVITIGIFFLSTRWPMNFSPVFPSSFTEGSMKKKKKIAVPTQKTPARM